MVDDHPIVRQGLKAALEEQGDLHVCGEAEDVGDALREFERTKPDVVLVDLRLRQSSGMELIERLRSKKSRTPILVASMYDEALYAERALAAGAQGYISKGQAAEKIVAAIRQVLAGRIYLSEEMTSKLLTRAVHGNGSEPVTGISSLSNRELEIFEQLGLGMTTAEIAARLKLSTKTVETHRLRIREKLELPNAAKLVREATQWVLENRNVDLPKEAAG